jgi:membrane protein implicated in regulation of membrane protease activity
MDAWVWWLIITGVLLVGEMLTTTLVLGLIAGGTGAAMAAAAVGAPVSVQVGVFAVVSIGLVFGVRPIARRHRKAPPEIRTGTDALVGREAEVLDRVDSRNGRVKLAGEVWSARAIDEHRTMDVGENVRVIKIDGATVLVD